ncbi:TonB-dependent receptor [Paracidobacterium acidisoli]|uniref:TonB-dependent receptor n=1 Tax=Paracidobacterium acidisoli TaxID=2303751 RepID=A0A372IUQ1_9BACT|nr:TonB-dependent receptor [Paracidobacterium acidisoli]MBT9330099.1 carboxypeptidase regulatory-like domain-containing protein [Paracidobacterium acidisoli]
MRWVTRTALVLLFLAGLGASSAFAQFLSGIEGTVQDPSGAAIPGAKVTVTNTQIGVSRTITTNQAGYFRIDSIAASTYTVHIEANGFKAWDQKDLALQVGEIRTITPALEVGEATTSVTVSASQVALDLVTPTTGSVIGSETVQQTPLPDQNVYGLASLTPGMTGTAVTSGDNYTNEYAININAAGLRQEQNGYQIDGAYTNTPSRGGGTSISPNPEIVQSIDIRTNDFDASKGRNGGATVDVFTKSGTNDFHGTIDYYFRNNDLESRTEFEPIAVPAYSRNEVSGTFGGPVIKNKLFIFGAIDVLRSSTTSAGSYTVETQDFDNWAKTNLPNTVATQVLTTAPPLNFPTSGFKTVAQYEQPSSDGGTPGAFAPPANLPANLNVVGTSNISYSVPKNGYQWSVRGDYYINQSDRVYVDGLRTYDTTEAATPRPVLNANQANSSDFVNVDWTHTFSAHLLNEVGANIIRPYGSNLAADSMAIPYINVTGLQGFSNWGPGNFTQSTLGWRDVMTATIKTHTLKFGFEQFNIRENDSQSGAFDRPTYNFNSLLDFVQDKAFSASSTPVSLLTHAEAPYNRRYRALYTGVFVQDDWKVIPRLTLNAGVRYDTMANFFSIESPQLTNFSFGSGATTDEQIASGSAGLAKNNHVLGQNVWGLTPRIGFSWDVFGTGRTAVRGGVGMFSDQPPYIHITDITAGNLPNFYTPSISVQQGQTPDFQLCSAPSGFSEVCPVVDTSNVVLNPSGGIDGQKASLGGYSPNYKFTSVTDWTLSIQQELPGGWVAELNYSASAARHLPVFNQDINRFAGDLVVNNGALARLNPNFGQIQYATSNGNSIGNYGTAMLQRRLNHGVALRGIYTFGKALDVISQSGSLDSGQITPSSGAAQNIIQNGNLSAQRGRADFDIRQQFSVDGTWTVPNDYGSRWKRNALGGWQFGGVWIMQTGLPFTVYTSAAFNPIYNSSGQVIGNSGGDYNADGSNYDVPNVPTFGSHVGGQSRRAFLKGVFPASAFPVPALGTEGDLGRNTYDQPGYNNVDFNLDKFFHVPWFFGEKLQLEGKGEFINIFNRANLTSVNSDLSSSLFGQATSQLPPRRIQFHVRASF